MISDLPVEPHEMDIDRSPAFPPTDEDLNLEISSGTPPGPRPHFTEVELGNAGDSWDADSWAAGFDSEEDVNLDFNSPDIPSVPVEATAIPDTVDEVPASVEAGSAEEERESVEETAAAETAAAEEPGALETVAARDKLQEIPPIQATPPDDIAVIDEPVTEMIPPQGDVPVEPAAEYPPEPAPEEETLDEVPEEEVPEEEDEHETQPEYEPEPEEASFVAYSPQLPEKEDLPHYTPQHPTVREFFAALGAFRPSSTGSVFTAHAAAAETVPQGDENSSAGEDYPLANDAFGNLFGDTPVDDEDNRAAFMLSGAIGASTPPSNIAVSAPTEPQPAEPPASEGTAQESEEDIRRFREWLDGLAES
jgi:hypothetical protein